MLLGSTANAASPDTGRASTRTACPARDAAAGSPTALCPEYTECTGLAAVARPAHFALEDDRMSQSNEAVRGSAPAVDTAQLAVEDQRTGRAYQVPIRDGSVRAIDLRQIRTGPDDFGLMSYDPGFLNTASCRSAVTYIDGDRGILLYRGYPIEQIAGHATFLDVAYLILYGELPTPQQLAEFQRAVARDSAIPDGIVALVESFPRDAHPMTILLSAVGALAAYHPEAKNVEDPAVRASVVTRLIGSFATLAGLIYRHVTG